MISLSRMLGRMSRDQAIITEGAESASRALRIPTYREFQPVLNDELARARRYQRPLSALVTRPESDPIRRLLARDPGQSVAPALENTCFQFVFFLLGTLLKDTLRSNDRLCYLTSDHLYLVLLIESTPEDARFVVRRLDAMLRARISVSVAAGVSEFPRNGLTIPDLVSHARLQCRREPLTIDREGDYDAAAISTA